ncbi:hypothetical protein ACOMHN_011161 [Nucella lapillus]
MSQRMRRNPSPSTSNVVTKQGPLKAVRAFSLKNSSSDSRSSNSSPTARESKGSEKSRGSRKSPDCGLSPERRNLASPNQKEKSRSSHLKSPVQYWSVSGCRASSADPLVPYLTGQWPRDISSYHHYHSGGIFMCDKSTQTADNLDQVSEKKKSKKSHRRSSSDHGDLLKEIIKQRLQKSKEGSRHHDWSKQRWSPVAGVHYSALSLTAPPTVFAQSKPVLTPPHAMHFPSRQNIYRFQHSSVEGLNVEIEKLVLSKSGSATITGHDLEDPEIPRVQDIPEGHRAPLPEVSRLSCTRTVDTQTPSGQGDITPTTVATQAEIAPTTVGTQVSGEGEVAGTTVGTQAGGEGSIPGDPQRRSAPGGVPDLLLPDSRCASGDSRSSKGDSELGSPELSKFESSPKPEKSCPFVREPPDGCEKVRVIEETRRPSIKDPLFCPVKPQFVFKQSQDSAFCPLIKQYLDETGDRSTLRPPSAPLTLTPCLAEGQPYH